MRLMKPLLALATTLSLTSPALAEYRDTSVPISAQAIDLKSYLGKWYEIARYPNNFERNCAAPTATYGMNEDGTISVLNACRGGRSREAVAKPVGPGKLKVDFVPWLGGLAEGDYWVLYVDPGYNLAVVGEPTGRFGWILSRTPQIRQSQLDRAKAALEKNGYDTSALMLVAR